MADYRPRRLPVFEPVKREAVQDALPEGREVLFRWNGNECSRSCYVACEGLGYEGKAVHVKKGTELSFDFNLSGQDSVEVEVRLLPNHPVEGNRLRFLLSLDGTDSAPVGYETLGRSEEWKENVLRNQAVRCVVLPLGGKRKHRLAVRALDEGVVLDQVMLYLP